MRFFEQFIENKNLIKQGLYLLEICQNAAGSTNLTTDRRGQVGYIYVYFSDFLPSLTYRLNFHFLSFYLAKFLIFFHLAIFSSFFICVSDSLLFLLVFLVFLTFLSTDSWVTLLLFFLSLCSFNPTFQSIPHNRHPQLMALPWVKVHNTQSWVRAIKRVVYCISHPKLMLLS